MIHNDIQNQLAFLIKTSAPPLIDVSDNATDLPQLVPGQKVPAFVLASLPNGRFQVQVEDSTLDMNLPRGTQVGDNIELVYVSDKPKPTFTLLSDLVKTGPQSPSNTVNLSQTGKLVTTLLQQLPQQTTAQAATTGNAANAATTALTNTAPIIPGAPPATEQFASVLRDAVSQSGLFYESHQAQWATGQRSLETLLQEPQAKLSPVLERVLNAAVPVEAKVAVEATAQTKTAETIQPQLLVVRGSAEGVATTQNSGQGTTSPVHAMTAPLVQQQLDILDTRQIVWQGQVWPGQDMQWEINEDDGRDRGETEERAAWSTKLRLDFPALGGVTAHLALGTHGLKVDFSVERDQSANLMRGEATHLAQAMEAAGLTVAGIAVTQLPTEAPDGNA
ncbi:MAG: flagellar hook-length control protein FliK [Methylophilaceae bacterium]